MRSPADMEVIQIEITNACLHSCSNCTRFCAHQNQPFFMDWITFKRAVDSLNGYKGIIGLMGGEPLLHPKFKEMTIHLSKKHGARKNLKALRRPVKDFIPYIRAKHNADRVLNQCQGPGLWTSMPKQYYKHYELIQDSFVFQSLNDHCNPSYHQPLLVSRKDLNVPDDEWFVLRDNCWVQNCWSASITPKGAFFCEVAAALDYIFQGPGGWPIEPGWWKRTPDDFADQLHWCELCGAALKLPPRDANEHLDDVSPALLQMLQAIESPGLGKKRVNVLKNNEESLEPTNYQPTQEKYIDDHFKRLGTSNKNLLPKHFNAIVYIGRNDSSEDLERHLSDLSLNFEQIFFIVEDINQLDNSCKLLLESFDNLKIIHNSFSLGVKLNQALDYFKNNDWVFLMETSNIILPEIESELKKLFLNPGCFYIFESLSVNEGLQSKTALFNQKAHSLARAGYDGTAHCHDIESFQALWPVDKQILLPANLQNSQNSDENMWKKMVDDDFFNDQVFFTKLKLVMSQAAARGSNIFLTQSASYFLTRALCRLIQNLGYNPYVLTHQRFLHAFKDILPEDNLFVFHENEMMKYVELKSKCAMIRKKIFFQGAVVPYSTPRSIVEPEDGYQDIEKLTEYTADRIICRVNIKRQFVHGHENHDAVYDNRWGY